MADDAPKKPKRTPIPLALRLTFTPVMLVALLLVCVRILNAVNLYPPLPMDKTLAPKLLAQHGDAKKIEIETEDGLKLYGWVIGDSHYKRHIIACTGNGDFVGSVGELYAKHAHGLRATILIFDYRGYANSPGTPSEIGLYADARAAWRYAVHELGWKPGGIVLWGRSLGCAPVIKLATDQLEAGTPPEALILEAPFTSIHDMARVAMPALGKPEWLIYESYDNLARAPKLTLPVFHCQGTRDEIIPHAQGDALFNALPGPKRHLDLPGAGHNDIWDSTERANTIIKGIDEFLGALE